MKTNINTSVSIDCAEVLFIKENNADSIGCLFMWNGRLFRGIYHSGVAQTLQLFASGLIERLIKENLFPRTWITDYSMDKFGLVVEHEIVRTVTYPFEWSFTMLQDAAVAILRVNEIARGFGWQTKDCHGFNILFDANIPKFVDLGSFISIEQGVGWVAYEEFLWYFFYPLKIWSQGNYYLGRYCLMAAMPHESYLYFRFPFVCISGMKTLRKIQRLWLMWGRLSFATSAQIKKKLPGITGVLLSYVRGGDPLAFSRLDNKVRSIKRKVVTTKWGNYQDQFLNMHDDERKDTRFSRIIELIKKYDVESIVDLGGNQGIFALQLTECIDLKFAYCADSDEAAIEKLYLKLKEKNNRIITPVLIDIKLGMRRAGTREPCNRLKADAAVALALTHHLLLSQNMSATCLLESIGAYAQKYVFIEFMPRGLIGPDGTGPTVPNWYTTEWFRDTMSRQFKLLYEEQLAENRILFIGSQWK